MPHTIHDPRKLKLRVRRIRGQVNAVEKALDERQDCAAVLLTLAACRGAINSLMAEILEDHVRHHVLDPKDKLSAKRSQAVDDLVDVIHSYLK